MYTRPALLAKPKQNMTLQNISEPPKSDGSPDKFLSVAFGKCPVECTPIMCSANLHTIYGEELIPGPSTLCSRIASTEQTTAESGSVASHAATVSPELAFNESKLFEVLGESSEPLEPVVSTANPFAVLASNTCTRLDSLAGKARTLVRFYRQSGLRQISDPPSIIECGGLRSAVRQCFGEVSVLSELSFKTVAKVEKNCCSFCLPRFEERLIPWYEARFDPQDVDFSHVSLFKESVRRNVIKGWDRYRRPFIPNGHATLSHGRKSGGNWNLEEFSDTASACLVFSSGKPRIVTKYSSYNTSVLGPLHYSLYHCLKRRGWLLVGDPHDEHVRRLRGADLLSFDYASATDNIKREYVLAAVDVLKEQAESLTLDEVRALDVLSSLKFEGESRIATRGQPMGSVMSFPLLCLINKSVVDLTLNQMLERGEISFNEWSSHRCLINGDDLLTREVRKDTNFRGLLSEEGSKVGLVVNIEKTMSSPNLAEINSTLFRDGSKERKFNAAALWMDAGVRDVLGFASEACPDVRSFRRVVRANCHILAKQEDKFLDLVPCPFRRVCRVDRRIRAAITSLPLDVARTEQGVISMARKPENYELSRDDEHSAMISEIARVRPRALARCSAPATKFRTSARSNAQSYSSVLKFRRTAGQEVIPACYVRLFRKRKWESLGRCGVAPDLINPVLDESKINYLIDYMRSRKRETAVRDPGTFECESDRILRDTFASNCDYVLLDC